MKILAIISEGKVVLIIKPSLLLILSLKPRSRGNPFNTTRIETTFSRNNSKRVVYEIYLMVNQDQFSIQLTNMKRIRISLDSSLNTVSNRSFLTVTRKFKIVIKNLANVENFRVFFHYNKMMIIS